LTITDLLISRAMEGNGAFGKHPCTKAAKNEPAICGDAALRRMLDIRSAM
jgi:hypothetical protein